jgi:hypothetical protein
MIARFPRRAIAFFAVLAVVTAMVTACGSSGTSCNGKNCPARVTARHDMSICGPAGCAWYYFLYFQGGLFQQIAYAQYLRYPVGSTYGSFGGLYGNAGYTVFDTLTLQDQQAMDAESGTSAAGGIDDDSYSQVVQQVTQQDEDSESAAESDPDGDGEPSVEEQESYDPVESYSDDVDVDDGDG